MSVPFPSKRFYTRMFNDGFQRDVFGKTTVYVYTWFTRLIGYIWYTWLYFNEPSRLSVDRQERKLKKL